MSIAYNAHAVEHAADADFREKVFSSDVPVLVDFYADWCGPCRMLAPVLEELARETPNAKIVKVNVDDSPNVAYQYRIQAVPTLMVFKKGRAVAQHAGLANKASLKALLAR